MRKLLFICLLGGGISYGQNAHVSMHTAPLSGTVILKDVEDKYNAAVYSLESPLPDGNVDRKKLYKVKEESAKMFPYKRVNATANKTTAAAAPVVVRGYVADSLVGTPPDNDMAMSKGKKLVSVVNSFIAVTSDDSGKMVYRKALKAFSSAVNLSGLNDYRYDPKVMYDQDADKFIVVMLNSINEGNYIVVGFSKTNDPGGAWNFYKFYGDYKSDTTWFDYPCVSITKDEFFLTGNKIRNNASWQAGFKETVIYQINKNDGINGATSLSYKIWDSINFNGIQIRNLYPVKGGNGFKGPEQYFLSNRNFDVQNDTVFLVKVPDLISSGNNNLDIKVLISPTKYGVPPDGRQPDTSATLATNDGRVLGAYRDDDEIQFVSTCVAPVSGASGIYHGIIRNYASTPTIASTQILSVDTLDFGYPNVTFASPGWTKGHSIISFNFTGPNTFPGIGAIMFDGSSYSPMTVVKSGVSSIKVLTGKQQRWGDYMGAQVDWNNIGSVWVEGIFGRVGNTYGNWMAKLNSPVLGIKIEERMTTMAEVYPNPALDIVNMNFELSESTAVSFAIYDMQGKLVDKLLDYKCKKGANRITFSIAVLAKGNYVLKAITADGQTATAQTFTKQ